MIKNTTKTATTIPAKVPVENGRSRLGLGVVGAMGASAVGAALVVLVSLADSTNVHPKITVKCRIIIQAIIVPELS